MPVLLYCVSQHPPSATLPAGVAGAAVEHHAVEGLQGYFSEVDAGTLSAEARERALEFHRVVKEIFARQAVISFRFPTAFASAEELAQELRPQAPAIAQFLAQHADDVQMDVRVAVAAPGEAQSGAEYLRARQQSAKQLQAAADAVRAAVARIVSQWCSRAQVGGVRLCAMMRRADVAEFRAAAASANMPDGVTAVVSGPWPANAFLELPRE